MKRKTKNTLLVAGVVLASVAAVAGISYGVAVNKEGTDKVNDTIAGWLGDHYSLKTNDKTYNFIEMDIMEKMYVLNEGNLTVAEYETEKAYREDTKAAVITEEYSESDYKEDNKDVKIFRVTGVELSKNEVFDLKHIATGNVLEEENFTISNYWGSEAQDMISTTFELQLKAAAEGSYDFYLVDSESSVKLIVDYTAVNVEAE